MLIHEVLIPLSDISILVGLLKLESPMLLIRLPQDTGSEALRISLDRAAPLRWLIRASRTYDDNSATYKSQ